MRHFYNVISLEPDVLAQLVWQPIDGYETRPMERRGRPLPAVLRQDDIWVFGSWVRNYGWVCQEGDRAGQLIEGFEPAQWAAPSEDLAWRLAEG
jgi:hypothetical protein